MRVARPELEEVLVRLVTYARCGRRARPGAVVAGGDGDRVLDLGAARRLGRANSLTRCRRAWRPRGAGRCGRAGDADAAALPALDAAALLAPVTPGKILCLGLQLPRARAGRRRPDRERPRVPRRVREDAEHARRPERARRDPAAARPTSTTRARSPSSSGAVRSACRWRTPSTTSAGYTILNDVSDRAWQRRQSQWALGKCFDGFAPLGPWVVTADEVGDPQDLLVEVVRDGVVTVSQSTSTTIFSVAFVMHHLSQVHDARAGRRRLDRHAAEAARGAQAAHRPLADGDAVTVRISRPRRAHHHASSAHRRSPDQEASRMILDSFRLDGKVALVTGSSRGLGQGAAVALAEAGADVALLDRGDASATAERIARDSAAACTACSATSSSATADELASAVDEVIDELGGLDILVNNAGTIRRAPAAEYPARTGTTCSPSTSTPSSTSRRPPGATCSRRAAGASSTSRRCCRSRAASSFRHTPRPSTPSPGSPRRSPTSGRPPG